MNKKSFFPRFTLFEKLLWLCSVIVVSAAFLIPKEKDLLTLVVSLIGVSALIFIAKGHVIGQALIIAFAVCYGLISFYFQYYGEMITYLGMSAPMAIISLISWLRHPFRDTQEVAVESKLTRKRILLTGVLTVLVTVLFYFILKHFHTARLWVSTLSVTTSFVAVSLTACRSPYYALAYTANDVVLILLWSYAAILDTGSIPMVACFSAFLANDIHGFISWKRMEKRQKEKL